MCFFFSSRRRHTRCSRDWSSDVCSSDLEEAGKAPAEEQLQLMANAYLQQRDTAGFGEALGKLQIGRESGRGRRGNLVVARSLKKKKSQFTKTISTRR